MAHAPPSITDHITDQNTPYCDELGDAVYNENRVLAVTWCRYREPSPCGGTISLINNNFKNYFESSPRKSIFSFIDCHFVTLVSMGL